VLFHFQFNAHWLAVLYYAKNTLLSDENIFFIYACFVSTIAEMQLGHKASPWYTYRTCLMHHTHYTRTSLLYAMSSFLILPPPISFNASFLPVHNLYHYHYFLTYLLTYSMEHSHSWEANRF